MFKDNLNINMSVATLIIIDEDGNIRHKEVYTGDIVTTVGKNRAASHLANSVPAKEWFTHIALGTNTDAESTEDPSLGAEFYRVALDVIWAVGETVFGHVVIQADVIGAGIITIAELGLLDASVGGNLICRQVLDTAETFSGTEKVNILWGVIVN